MAQSSTMATNSATGTQWLKNRAKLETTRVKTASATAAMPSRTRQARVTSRTNSLGSGAPTQSMRSPSLSFGNIALLSSSGPTDGLTIGDHDTATDSGVQF